MTSVQTSVLFAYDCSGSTGGALKYHNVSQRIASTLPYGSKIVRWDHSYRFIDLQALRDINLARDGYGGTEPVEIVKACIQIAFSGHLIILTDGHVFNVDKTDELMQNSELKFSRVTVHIVSPYGEPNLSVCAPFVRFCVHQVLLYGREQESNKVIASVTEEDVKVFESLEMMNTYEEFEEAYPSLLSFIRAATMGTTGNPEIRDRLLKLQKKFISARSQKLEQSSAADFLTAIKSKDFNGAKECMRSMHDSYFGSEVDESHFSTLLNMCNGSLRSKFDLSLDGIQAQRAARAETVPEVPTEELEEQLEELNDSECPALTCPITLDTMADIVLLVRAPEQPLLTTLSKEAANDVINNPLNAFFYPEFIKSLRDSLDTWISLEAYKAANQSGNPFTVSPLTRAPLCGALALSAHELHVAASDWTISKLVTGGKRLGNMDLWFALILLIVSGHKGSSSPMERLQDIVPFLKAHFCWRMENRLTYAALSGLPSLLCIRVPLAASLWYILHVCLLSDSRAADPLKLHLSHAHRFVFLLGIGGFQCDGEVLRHVSRLRAVLAMLRYVKRKQGVGESAPLETLRVLGQALYRNSTVLDLEEVPMAVRERESPPPVLLLDGEPSQSKIESIVKMIQESIDCSLDGLSLGEIAGLAAMADPSKSAGSIDLPWNWQSPAVPMRNPEWPIYSDAVVRTAVRVCEATARPFSRVHHPVTGELEPWQKASERAFGDLDLQMNTKKYFGLFVSKYEDYPSMESLLAFFWRRVVGPGRKSALPWQVCEFAAQEMEDHAELMRSISPKVFAERWNGSVVMESRAEKEADEMLFEDSRPEMMYAVNAGFVVVSRF